MSLTLIALILIANKSVISIVEIIYLDLSTFYPNIWGFAAKKIYYKTNF